MEDHRPPGCVGNQAHVKSKEQGEFSQSSYCANIRRSGWMLNAPRTMTVIAAMAMRLINIVGVSDLFFIESVPLFADTFLMSYSLAFDGIVIACVPESVGHR